MLRFNLSTGLILFITFFTNLQLVFAQADYYYHFSEKVYIESKLDSIAIQFEEGYSVSEKLELLKEETRIQSGMKLISNGKLSIYPTQSGLQRSDINQMLNSFNARTGVKRAYSVYQKDGIDFVINENIIVCFQATLTLDEIMQMNKSYNVEIVKAGNSKRSRKSNRYILRVKQPNVRSALQISNLYHEDERTIYACPDTVSVSRGILSTTPNDTYFSDQKNLKHTSDKDIDADEAWDTETGSSNIVIAVIDTGVDTNHEDLNIWTNTGEIAGNSIDDDSNGYIDDVKGWDFVPTNGDNDPQGNYEHGTPVAGIAGAIGNNSKGVAGVCWGASIMPIRIMDDSAILVSASKIADAIDYAVDNGADIINCSWTSSSNSDITAAIQNAKETGRSNKGCLVVCGSGNDGDLSVRYPANLKYCIAVGGSESNDKTYGSNGTTLDVLAPRTADAYTKNGNGYNVNQSPFSGTSAAAPLVSGLAALFIEQDSNLTANQIQALIQFSAEDQLGFTEDTLGRDEDYGYGRINAKDALDILNTARMKFTDSTGLTKFSYDTDGHIILEGSLVESATAGDLIPISSDLMIVRHPTSQAVLAIVSSEGHLYLKGTLTERKSSISPGIYDPFVQMDGVDAMLCIDSSGNLDIRGRLFTGNDPDRSSSQGN